MRFLILGASGMAGHVIGLYLKENGHDVMGYSRRSIPFLEVITGDVKDTEKLRKVIEDGGYDVIINAVGILNQSAEENKAEAVYVNAYLPHILAQITKDMPVRVMHMSTDCVFSGKTGGYTEDSIPDGESFYDRSKALGELRDEKNVTFRNSIIGPDINPGGIGLFNWFMAQKGEINGYTHAMWTGLTTLDLAKVMEKAAIEKATGLVNMVYETNISKYELLKLFNTYFKEQALTIHAYDGFSLDKTLIRTNYEFAYAVPDYETMIADMAVWMKKHKELYPHYVL